MSPDHQYLSLVEHILNNGHHKQDRTGVGTTSVFGTSMRFDIGDGKIPLLTTKKVFTKGIIHELLWMLSGDTNIRYLKQHGVSIWDSWIDPKTVEYRPLDGIEIINALIRHCKAKKFTTITNTNFSDGQYGLHADKDDPTHYVFEWNGASLEAWVNAYRDQIGEEPRVLVAGELPKIYQHQWRRWEDIRIVDTETLDRLEAQGTDYVCLGEVGPDQWVVRREIDQIAQVIEQLKTNPDSRRILLSAWNVAEIDEMALPPCHVLAQFYTTPMSVREREEEARRRGISLGDLYYGHIDSSYSRDELDEIANRLLSTQGIPERKLSCQLYQRSADVPLGVPFNIVQYSLLTHLFAHVVNMATDEFIWVGGDTHIYQNQVDGIREQLKRSAIEDSVPRVILNKEVKSIFDFTYDDIEIVDYKSHPAIKFPPAAV